MHQVNGPLLSVVVPIYNVDRYLDECLTSIASQELHYFEAVLVDDGSTDRSGEIASQWCKRDPRFRLIQQDNGGLGHARNTGVGHATGTYLAFLDSDDVIPPDTYQTMIDTLEETGSDFATGNVHRYDSGNETWQSPLYKWMTHTPRLRTHVSKYPKLLRDHLAPNKVFRTSFWKESGARFPVGVLYEDIPTIIPAHVRAKAVDVVPIIATLWRVRDQGDSSITQSRHHNPSHIRDRVDGMLHAAQVIDEHGTQKLKDEYDSLVLRRDLRWYIDLYLEVDDEYRKELFASVLRFKGQASPEAIGRVPVNLRPAYELIEAGAHDDLSEFIAMRHDGRVDELPTVVREGQALIDLDLPSGTALPADALDITNQLKPESRVSDLRVTDSEVVIEGWAYIPGLPVPGSARQEIEVWFKDGGQHDVYGEVAYRNDTRAAVDAGATAESTGSVAFTARIPTDKLRRRHRRRHMTWQVMVSVAHSGISRKARLRSPLPGKPERPITRTVSDGRWLQLAWSDRGLVCHIHNEAAVLKHLATTDQAFEFTLQSSTPVHDGAFLKVRAIGGEEAADFPLTRDHKHRNRARALVPISDLPGFTTNDAAITNRVPEWWDALFETSESIAGLPVQTPRRVHEQALVVNGTEFVLREGKERRVRLAALPPIALDSDATAAAAPRARTFAKRLVRLGARTKYRGTEKAFQLAHMIIPRHAGVVFRVGRARERLKDWPGAEAAYTTGIALGGTSLPTFLARRADVRARQNRWLDAMADCSSHPDVAIPSRLLPRVAQRFRAEGRVDDALALLRPAVAENPTGATLEALAACHEDLGDFDTALRTYKEAAQEAPDDLTIRTSLGELQSRRSLVPFDMSSSSHERINEEVAEKAFAEALALLESVAQESTSPWASFRLGQMLESHGMYVAALRAYDAAVQRVQHVDKSWAHNAGQLWHFRRSYVEHRATGEPGDDPQLNRTFIAMPSRDGMSGVVGFFEPKVIHNGLVITGFVLGGHEGSIEVCVDGQPIMAVSGNANSQFRSFKATIVRNVLDSFPRNSILSMRVGDAPLVTKGGADAVTVNIPDGSGQLRELLQSGQSINKKGRWSVQRDAEVQAEEQLTALEKAQQYFADSLGISLFVSYGTLLGCYRDGRPIPTDDDFDVSFVANSTSPKDLKAEVSEVIRALMRGGYDARVAVDGRMFHLRVDDVMLDVNPFWFFDGRAWAFDAHDLDRDDFEPIESIDVLGFNVNIPARPEAFLEGNYGADWRTPRSDFQYHRPKPVRAVLRQAFLTPSEVAALQDYSENLRSEIPNAGKFHGYGDAANPRFQ